MTWLEDRAGCITASRVHRLMSNRATTVIKFIAELIDERKHGPKPQFSTTATEHGKIQESSALKKYSEYTGKEAEDCFELFLEHPHIKFVGCSPDGLVFDNQLIENGVEVKCPVKLANHTKYFDPTINFYRPYFWQIQHSLLCTEASYWDFISYFPGQKIWIERFERIELVQELLEERSCWASNYIEYQAVPTEKHFADLEEVKLPKNLRGEAITADISFESAKEVAGGTLLDYVGL